jgi:WD40 repeat protein
MRIPVLLSTALAVLLLAATGCGNGKDPSTGDGTPGGNETPAGLISLTLEPADALLVVEAGQTPASLSFRALGTFENGQTRDITPQVRFSSDNSFIGGFSGNTFTTYKNQGGITTVSAVSGTVRGETRVLVKLQASVKDPASTTVPADASARFSGPTSATRRPDLVYPNDGVLMPPNMRGAEFHFLPGTSNTLFELAFQNDVTDIKVYLRCTQPLNGGCIYRPDDNTWLWIAQTNRGGQPVTVTLRGTDDSGTQVGTAASLSVAFARDDLTGGLYYWTTSNDTAIMRFDFTSASQSTGEKFVGPEVAGGECIGCHALSRDGRKMVAEASGQNSGRIVLLDVGSKSLLAPYNQGASSPDKSIFESWNPDGSQYVGVYADSGATDFNLMLFDGNTGKRTRSLEGTGTSTNPVSHPDWSLDGQKIAFVRMGVKGTNQRFGRGSIQMVSQSATGWSAPVTLVPAVDGKNRYYPAFSPDNTFLLYNESTCPTGTTSGTDCNADSDPSAKLFAVRAQVGATPIELARANAPGKRDTGASLTNSFPKWAPFLYQRTRDQGSKLQWFTFSSTRKYGLRNPPAGGGDENTTGTLLWIAAIDPDKVALGQDPSYPALVLPIQDISTSNHIAQWTKAVVPIIR